MRPKNVILYHHRMAIGSLIQAWRTSRRQSIEALAQKAKILPETLEAIELERADPSLATLESVAAALQIPPAWLFADPSTFDLLFDDPDAEEPAPVNGIDPVTERILLASRSERHLYALLTALLQSGDPKLVRTAEMSLRSLVKQSRQATVPWQSRPPGHFEPPSD